LGRQKTRKFTSQVRVACQPIGENLGVPRFLNTQNDRDPLPQGILTPLGGQGGGNIPARPPFSILIAH
jgi:hypothetical protein